MAGLTDFRVPGDQEAPPERRGRGGAVPWEPLRPDLITAGEVLAWDQSLGKAAFCVLASDGEGTVEVLASAVIRTEGGQRGWAQKLARVEDLTVPMAEVMGTWGSGRQVAHEAPVEGGSKFGNSESSALASAVIRVLCATQGLPLTMIPSQTAKRLVTGNSAADKPRIRQVLTSLGWVRRFDRITNEDQRDALAVALAFLHAHRRKS